MIFCCFWVLSLSLASCLLVQGEFPPPAPTVIEIDIASMSDADHLQQLMEAKAAHVLAVCGEHPLQAVLDKIEGKLEHEEIVQLLSSIRYKAARLWKAYEHALKKYSSCKLMAGGGTLG